MCIRDSFLVNKLDLNLKKFKNYKLSNTFQIDGTQCQIALSENYMNESGNGVLSLKTTKLSKSDVLFVIYDELDLSLGEIKIKYAGGNAGHNGLRSISSKIGDNYWKLRIGVDHPGDKEQVTRHVLGNFKENEKKILNNLFELIYLNLSQIFISRHLSNLGI